MWWPTLPARVVGLVQQNLQQVVGVAAIGATVNAHIKPTGRPFYVARVRGHRVVC